MLDKIKKKLLQNIKQHEANSAMREIIERNLGVPVQIICATIGRESVQDISKAAELLWREGKVRVQGCFWLSLEDMEKEYILTMLRKPDCLFAMSLSTVRTKKYKNVN